MDNVYRIAWEGCPAEIQAYVVDEPSNGSSLEGAIRPLMGKCSFQIWNTKPDFKRSVDFADWRGQCVDIVASFDASGQLYRLDPGAVRRGLVQPGLHKNAWADVPSVLRKIAREQSPEWAEKLEKKWGRRQD